MKLLINVLLEECKKNIERTTGKVADLSDQRDELDRIFKKADIHGQNKSRVLKVCETGQGRISRGFAIALGIAFGFNLEEINTFLPKLGHYLTEYYSEDKIIIDLLSSNSSKKCTVDDANQALYEAELPLLTSRKERKEKGSLPK